MPPLLRWVAFICMILLAACSTEPTLPQSISSADGSLTVGYPDGWMAEASENLVMIRFEAAAGMTIQVEVKSPRELSPQLRSDSAPALILEILASELPPTTSITPPRLLRVTGLPAAQIIENRADNQSAVTVIQLADDRIALIRASTLPGALERFQPELSAILESIRYRAP